MKIVTVIPLKKGVWKGEMTYFTAKHISNGSIVIISLRNKKILGLVVSSENVLNAKSNIKNLDFNLKKIIEVKKHSIFLKKYLDAALEISKYCAASKNNIVTSLLPSIFREEYDKISKLTDPTLDPPLRRGGLSEVNLRAEKMLFQAPPEERISSYKTLIRGSFASKKSVFIVLPTERDISNWEIVLSKGIEQFTFVIHSGFSPKKIKQKFEQIVNTEHPVLILGTAPFLSIPRNDLGTIVVEHESSSVYKTIGQPHLDLRIFAELFASKTDAKFILSDSLLRFESIARKETDGLLPMHPLSFRINFEGEIKVENPRKKTEALLPLNGNKASVFKIFSDESIKEIENAIAQKKSVFIFSLRKGLATMTLCKDCNSLISCEKCSAPLVLYLSHNGQKRVFVCNRCERESSGETVCATCGSWNLMPLGIGTDTVFEEVKKTFPKIKILKLDKDSARSAQGAEKIIQEFEKDPGSILVGTELALFYLQDKKAPLSIVASFDSLWSIPNFKMNERIIQLMIAIISKTTEKFIIQTKNENDPAILAIQQENLLSFVRQELEDRKNLNYPPFRRFIKITHLGSKEQTTKAREMLKEIFKEYDPEIFSGFVAKFKGKYVTNALIKLDPKKWSLPELSLNSSIDENLLQKLLSLPPSFEVTVDPEDLL